MKQKTPWRSEIIVVHKPSCHRCHLPHDNMRAIDYSSQTKVDIRYICPDCLLAMTDKPQKEVAVMQILAEKKYRRFK